MKRKKTKSTYRLRNWSDYNKALVNRGSLTIWVSEDVLAAWRNIERTGKRGKPVTYADTAILCMATLMEVYHLPLRGAEGLLRSIVRLMKIGELPVPDYSTLCRRRQQLEVMLPRLRKSEPLHLVVDSTGVKVYGEGEWKVRQHGVSKRRTWRKLHLGIDQATHEIVASIVSTNAVSDGQCLPELLEQVEGEVAQVSGDGG